MNTNVDSTWYIVTVVFVAFVGLFGMGIMFARSSNIERNGLVGSLTVLSSLIAAGMLYAAWRAPTTLFWLVMIALVSTMGYFLGRGIDMLLGGKGPSDENRKGTLGADLSD